MLILDATTKSLEVKLAGAVSANELPVTAHYTDITTTLYTPGSNDTQTNGATAVTIVAAPGASTQRHVESISVYNADTAAATVTIQLNNNSTLRIITKVTMQAGEQLFYEDGMGWQIIDANGAVIRRTNVSDTAYASSWDGVTTIAPSKNAVYDQMILQMLKNGSNLAIGSDADGDMYYRASSKLARLAKGDAKALLGMDDAQVPAYRKLMVSDAGIMTNAYQPAFLVTPASDQTDIAINENVAVVWGTKVFDTGGNFASNIFTAPVTGVYHFDVLLDLEDFDSAIGVLFVYIVVTGRNFRFKMSGNHVAADTDYTSVAFGVTVKLSATNTAMVRVFQSGGTAQLDITTNSYFSGFLIG